MDEASRTLGGRYEVGDLLGRGGMADVHSAQDTRLGRTVAIKLLRSDMARDPVFQARFRREAQSAAGLNHPAIVAVYDSGEEVRSDYGGAPVHLPFIVMERVAGRTVREVLTAAGGAGVGLEQAVSITTGILAALGYSHRHGVVHRDIKPANVMVTPAGAVKVMDFGIARSVADSSATMTQTSAVIGTAQYLSPEQAQGQVVDARTDLYSTGCLLYELLTGRPPFTGDSAVAVAYQHVREAPLPPSALDPTIGESVDRVVLHALAKDREERYATAADFAEDLLAAEAGREIAAPAAALATVSGPTRAAAASALAASPTGRALAGAPVDATVLAGDGAGTTGDLWVDLREETGGPAVLAGRTGRGPASPVPDDGRPPRRRRHLTALTLLLVALLAAAGLGTWYWHSYASRVVVPSLTGATSAQARQKLAAVHLSARTTSHPSSKAAGTVISQDPGTGEKVAAHSAVAIVVSRGPATVTVPQLAGRTEAQARQALESAGLSEGAPTTQDNPQVPAGQVISSTPAIGSRAPKGSVVSLVLSSGKVGLPDLRGHSLAVARKTISDLGLPAPFVVYGKSNSFPAGTVMDQNPSQGSADSSTKVTLVISSGPTSPPSSSPTPTATPSPSDSGTPSPTGTASDGSDATPSGGASTNAPPSSPASTGPAAAVYSTQSSSSPTTGPTPVS